MCCTLFSWLAIITVNEGRMTRPVMSLMSSIYICARFCLDAFPTEIKMYPLEGGGGRRGNSHTSMYCHLQVRSHAQIQQPSTQIPLIWNYDPLSQIFIANGYPFHWPTTNTHPFQTPSAHTITKNWPDVLPSYTYSPDFVIYHNPPVTSSVYSSGGQPFYYCGPKKSCDFCRRPHQQP